MRDKRIRLRKNRISLRHDLYKKSITVANDVEKIAEFDGDVITFKWKEYSEGAWNEVYQAFEGESFEYKTLEAKGFGRVVDFKEDEMEYEWGRVSVGECLVILPVSFDIESLNNKQDLKFKFKGVWWKVDGTLGVGDYVEGVKVTNRLKGVKSVDKT